MESGKELILSVESSAELCSVALSKGGVLINQKVSKNKREHASLISTLTAELFKESGFTVQQLQGVAISEGPGSYTGLRVGLSFAKGLCFALKIPLIAISTLDLLVQIVLEMGEQTNVKSIVPVIDARRMEVYTATYSSSGERLTKVAPLVVESNSFDPLFLKGKVLFCGDGAEKLTEVIESDKAHFMPMNPMAEGMVKLAHKAFKEGEFVDYKIFEPLYLKEFIAGKPKDLLANL